MQNKYILASISVFLLGFVSMAQGSTPPPPMPPPPPGLSVDGGIAALFAIAMAYGIYKAFKLSSKQAS
ncbi:hypothetical protein [Winogradskyella schleiferi]|uniref:hypothetical protein n=1 Tax=Winogradskyella schleiferi TaxID=2686078 RepID=UPI0015B87759|nr:hypothetical protein [Winogradskyella schleiferi]